MDFCHAREGTWRKYGSQHRHYPYWYEGTLSTRPAKKAGRVPLRESEV